MVFVASVLLQSASNFLTRRWTSSVSSAVVFAWVEAFKLTALLVSADKGIPRLRSSMMLNCLALAMLYAVNNSLLFVILKDADSGSLVLLKSAGSMLVAAFSQLFGERLSTVQLAAVAFQALGLTSVQWDPCEAHLILTPVVYALVGLSTVLSALGSVWNAYIVRNAQDFASVNVGLYVWGFFLNSAYHIATSGVHGLVPSRVEEFTLIAVHASVGLSIAYMYRVGNAVMKSFATATVAVVLSVASWLTGDTEPSVTRASGVLTVALALMLYVQGKK